MINIKKFIDRVSSMESNSNKDFVMSKHEARVLRDEIVKVLLDKVSDLEKQKPELFEVHVSGGRW